MKKAIKKIYERIPEAIEVPRSFRNRRVEVIWALLEEDALTPEDRLSRELILKEIMGSWKGEPLERPEQGYYETREPMR